MTDLETLLRETLHARADRAPFEHRVLAETLNGRPRPRSARARRFTRCAAAGVVAATVFAGLSATQQGGSPTMTDEPAGGTSQTSPDSGSATPELNEYTDAVTEKIVECLQGAGFAVEMTPNSQMSDGAGREQLTFRVPPAVQADPAYRAATETCVAAAEAAVPRPLS